MNQPAEVNVAVEQIGFRRRPRASFAVIGNPNAGKSALFNRLTGMNQKTANYPGVTVERRSGRCISGGDTFELIDLPGTYSLTPNSTDEEIAVGVLFGRVEATPLDGIIAVIDSTRLYQGLYLLQQLIELGRPMVVALTMSDVAERDGISIDKARLQSMLGGVPVFPVVATSGRGFDALIAGIAGLAGAAPPTPLEVWPELTAAVDELADALGQAPGHWQRAEIERWLIEGDVVLDETGLEQPSPQLRQRAAALRETLFGSEPPLAVEARRRYAWNRAQLDGIVQSEQRLVSAGARLIDWLNRPWISTALFLLTMAIVFQAVFSWATVFMDAIDGGIAALGAAVTSVLPEGMLASFVVDGVIAGVGSVVIFLPQICILFLFIILLEDTGYLARAAFLMDRAMRSIGLSGQSVIPLLSSFACAVPSIMATRVIPNRRDRIATILAAPFMTCSARLPVYALLIAAFVPDQTIARLNLQGLVLFGLYLIGILGGVSTAFLLKRSALRSEKPVFILALPEYRKPDLRSVVVKLVDRALVFLRRAGTIIFAVAVIVWALAYFPRSDTIAAEQALNVAAAEAQLEGEALALRLTEIDNEAAAAQLEQSLLGRIGQLVEPVFAPLGWDWKVSAAVIASFPAREVVVAVLGTIYAVGDEADELTLSERLQAATWPDGSPVYTLPMVFGLLLFYAWCMQCAATVAIIKRETNSWRWPVFSWTYMTTLAYLAALLLYQIGSG